MKRILLIIVACLAFVAGPVLATPAINASAPVQKAGIEIPTSSAEAAGYYRWGKTCAWRQISGQPHTNKLWAERREDIWFGYINMGCKLTGYQKWGFASPVSPWYDSSGKRIR